MKVILKQCTISCTLLAWRLWLAMWEDSIAYSFLDPKLLYFPRKCLWIIFIQRLKWSFLGQLPRIILVLFLGTYQ